MTAASDRFRTHLAVPLYRNGYLLTLGAGFGSMAGFLFWTIAARRYSPSVVGINSATISAMILVSAVCQLGLNAVVVRYLPAAGSVTRRLLVAIYAITCALSAVAAAGVALTSTTWGPPRLAFLSHGWWPVAFAAATVCWTVFTLQDSALTGMRAAHWVPIENSIFSLVKIALLLAFVGSLSRSGIFWAWNLPVLLSLVPINALIFGRLLPRHVAKTDLRTLDLRAVARFAGHNYVGSLFLLGSSTLLPVVVASEVGSEQTAFFYIPWTIATGVQLVALSTSTSLMVELAFDESRIGDYARRVLRQTLRLIVPAVVVLVAAAPWVLRAFGRRYAAEGDTLLRLLALAAIPNVLSVLGLAIARIRHDGRMVLGIQSATFVGTLGVSFVLLPRIGIVGVGWAWLATQTAIAAWLLARSLRQILSAQPSAGARGRAR